MIQLQYKHPPMPSSLGGGLDVHEEGAARGEAAGRPIGRCEGRLGRVILSGLGLLGLGLLLLGLRPLS